MLKLKQLNLIQNQEKKWPENFRNYKTIQWYWLATAKTN